MDTVIGMVVIGANMRDYWSASMILQSLPLRLSFKCTTPELDSGRRKGFHFTLRATVNFTLVPGFREPLPTSHRPWMAAMRSRMFTNPGALPREIAGRIPWRDLRIQFRSVGQTNPVVPNRDRKHSGNMGDMNPHFRRPRVFHRVIQRLLKGQKEIVPHFGQQHDVRQLMPRQFQAARHPGNSQVVLAKLHAFLRDKALQRIIRGIHRPDNFIQRGGQGPGLDHNFMGIAAQASGGDSVFCANSLSRAISVRCDPEVIVHVLGNPPPFAFDGTFAFNPFEPVAHAAGGDEVGQPGGPGERCQRAGDQ